MEFGTLGDQTVQVLGDLPQLLEPRSHVIDIQQLEYLRLVLLLLVLVVLNLPEPFLESSDIAFTDGDVVGPDPLVDVYRVDILL